MNSDQEWVEWTKTHTAIFYNSLGESSQEVADALGVSLSVVEQASRDVSKYIDLKGEVPIASQDRVNKVLLPKER
jgi:hypothetical protein